MLQNMELTPVQMLAGWIVYSQRAGENGPIFPPRETLEKIVKNRAGRFEEAEAMAAHFIKKLKAMPADGPTETGEALLRFVQGADKMLGGFFSTPPMKSNGGEK
jgi:hypothetical protein